MNEGPSGDLLSTRRIFHLLPDLKLSAAAAKTASAKTENTFVDGPFALPWPNRIEGRLRSVFGRSLMPCPVLSAPGVLTDSNPCTALQPRPPIIGELDSSRNDLFFCDRGQRVRSSGKQDLWRNGGGKNAVVTWHLTGREGGLLERRGGKVVQLVRSSVLRQPRQSEHSLTVAALAGQRPRSSEVPCLQGQGCGGRYKGLRKGHAISRQPQRFPSGIAGRHSAGTPNRGS